MFKIALITLSSLSLLAGCAATAPKHTGSVQSELKRDPNCKVNEAIERNAIPKTPHNMSLPSFGQGVIGWATGPEGAKARVETVTHSDIPVFKEKGVSLDMVEEWQAFYENEVKRNPCNPTAPYRAELMKKIADLWND